MHAELNAFVERQFCAGMFCYKNNTSVLLIQIYFHFKIITINIGFNCKTITLSQDVFSFFLNNCFFFSYKSNSHYSVSPKPASPNDFVCHSSRCTSLHSYRNNISAVNASYNTVNRKLMACFDHLLVAS